MQRVGSTYSGASEKGHVGTSMPSIWSLICIIGIGMSNFFKRGMFYLESPSFIGNSTVCAVYACLVLAYKVSCRVHYKVCVVFVAVSMQSMHSTALLCFHRKRKLHTAPPRNIPTLPCTCEINYYY